MLLFYPLFLKTDQSFIIIALQFLRLFADQGTEFCVSRTRPEDVEQSLQWRLTTTRGRTFLRF